MDREQWLSDGKCVYCRRADYCNKTCSAAKKRTESIFRKAYNDVLTEKYPELKAVIDNVKQ